MPESRPRSSGCSFAQCGPDACLRGLQLRDTSNIMFTVQHDPKPKALRSRMQGRLILLVFIAEQENSTEFPESHIAHS